LANADETVATVVFHGEDHTLGNALRYVLAKQPSTDFVGYNIPHPSEHKIHMRIQTHKSSQKKVTQALNESFDLMTQMCDELTATLDAAEQRAIKQGLNKRQQISTATDNQMEEQD
jgi:DNA-directed RNA polymerases I and III subunit RPAC2